MSRRETKATQYPPEVAAEVQRWREESNQLDIFLAECCTTDNLLTAWLSELYAAYLKWSVGNGQLPRINGNSAFGRALIEKSFESKKGEIGRRYFGMGLKADGKDGTDG